MSDVSVSLTTQRVTVENTGSDVIVVVPDQTVTVVELGTSSVVTTTTSGITDATSVGRAVLTAADAAAARTAIGAGTPYTLPIAAAGTLGGVRVGSNLSVDVDGILSASASSYTLPTATSSVLGGIKVGKNLGITSGVLRAVTGSYSVKDFGAVGDGGTDDAPAIQACINAAQTDGVDVYFPKPASSYYCASTIVYGVAGQQTYTGWYGDGRFAVLLTFPANLQVGIRVIGMFGGFLHGIGVVRSAGVDGSHKHWYNGSGTATNTNTDNPTIGIWLANTTGTGGTGQTGNNFEHLYCAGWTRGIMAGDQGNGRAASELHFLNCQFSDNDVGFQASDSNTLDINLTMCAWAENRIGVDTGAAGLIQIFGGSATGNRDADFATGTGSTFGLYQFRSENTNYMLFVYSTNAVAPTTIVLSGCHVSNCLQADGFAVWAFGCFHLAFTACDIRGKIGLADYYCTHGGTISLRNTTIKDTEPFRFYYGPDTNQIGDRTLAGIRYEVIGCQSAGDNWIVGKLDDEVGICVGGGSPDYGYRMAGWRLNSSTMVMTFKTTVTEVVKERPTGVINGTNKVFTLAYVPAGGVMGQVQVDGSSVAVTTGYTVSGQTITFVVAPVFTVSASYTV